MGAAEADAARTPATASPPRTVRSMPRTVRPGQDAVSLASVSTSSLARPPAPGGRAVRESDGLDVDGFRALGPGLAVVGHASALRERAVAVAVDAGVVDEQVLAGLIRR